MKPISTALQNFLFPVSGPPPQIHVADLYQFTLVQGGTLSYCSGDADIVWNSTTWLSGGQAGPFFDRTDNKAVAHFKVGVEVDQLTFDVIPGSASVFGEPFLSAVRQGAFDAAEVCIYRALMPSYGDLSMGPILWFVGRVADVDAGRSLATFTVNSHLELFNQNMPRNLYTAGCINTLYDSSCALNRASYAVTGAAAAGSSALVINATLGNPSGWFDLGSIAFTSGANTGLSRSVQHWTSGGSSPGTIALIAPFPTAPASGDAFTILPGCDKQQSTCMSKFNNLANFRGFPFIPQAETSV